MELPASDVFEVLANHDVKHLHHANSVITACQFLWEGSLLSRGTVERRGLLQTTQTSDLLDKKYSLWYDVFLDSVDIHERAGRANSYGPVLFVLDIERLRAQYTGHIWISKLNPTKWAGVAPGERWFTSVEDLTKHFVHGRFDQMIVFRSSGGELPLQDCLEKIVLDDPQQVLKLLNADYYAIGYGAMKLAMTESEIDVPIIRRKCDEACKCITHYAANANRTKAMYMPKV